MNLLTQTYLGDILNDITQALLIPTVILLIALILYVLWCIGSAIVEGVTERRHFKVAMPPLLDALSDAAPAQVPDIIEQSALLASQKFALLTLWDYRSLPLETHMALAKRLVQEQDNVYENRAQRTQAVSKVAPMLGLMGTLIPLGPGIVALSLGDTETLSSAMLTAFNTTVAGLVASIVTFIVTKVRRAWYEDYMAALEAATTTVLEKVEDLRQSGMLDTTRPTSFAQPYAALARTRSAKVATKQAKSVSPAAPTPRERGPRA